MIKIYHSPLSRSLRVVWLCEELGIDYETSELEMFSPAMKVPEYLAVHPLGKVPAIDDQGFVLWETVAIFSYLVNRYSDGALMPPPDSTAGALVLQWMTYAENPLTVIMGELAANSGTGLMPEEMRDPALVVRGEEIAQSLVDIAERALGDSDYIVGDNFTAADIMLVYGLFIAGHLEYVGEHTPKLRNYCERLMARPAYTKAMST